MKSYPAFRRVLITLAVIAAVFGPLSYCPVANDFKMDIHGVFGWTLFLGTLIATYIGCKKVVRAYARSRGITAISCFTYIAGRVVVFELFALAIIGLTYIAPATIVISSAAGLAILYGAMGLCYGISEVADAWAGYKFAQNAEK